MIFEFAWWLGGSSPLPHCFARMNAQHHPPHFPCPTTTATQTEGPDLGWDIHIASGRNMDWALKPVGSTKYSSLKRCNIAWQKIHQGILGERPQKWRKGSCFIPPSLNKNPVFSCCAWPHRPHGKFDDGHVMEISASQEWVVVNMINAWCTCIEMSGWSPLFYMLTKVSTKRIL